MPPTAAVLPPTDAKKERDLTEDTYADEDGHQRRTLDGLSFIMPVYPFSISRISYSELHRVSCSLKIQRALPAGCIAILIDGVTQELQPDERMNHQRDVVDWLMPSRITGSLAFLDKNASTGARPALVQDTRHPALLFPAYIHSSIRHVGQGLFRNQDVLENAGLSSCGSMDRGFFLRQKHHSLPLEPDLAVAPLSGFLSAASIHPS